MVRGLNMLPIFYHGLKLIVDVVLDLLDLPSTPSPDGNNLFTLMVAMGKTEYRTTGKGSFSFPVLSLRDRLTVTLYDAEGNEISRSEFKAISVVEKKCWDDVFPLEGGGRVHMKLEFSLSDEERKRIQDMREYAMKRKHEEMFKGGLKSSLSGEKIGGSAQFAVIEQSGEGFLTDQSEKEQTNPGVCGTSSIIPSLQNLHLPHEYSFVKDGYHLTEGDSETSKSQSALDADHQRNISAEEALDSQAKHSVSAVSKNVSKDRPSTSINLDEEQTHGPKRISLEMSFKSNVKKMIGAFESSQSQRLETPLGSKTKYHLNKIETKGSLKRTCSEESDKERERVPLEMPRSFSAGTLSESNSEQSFKVSRSLFVKEEQVRHFDQVMVKVTDNKIQLSNSGLDQNSKNLDSYKQESSYTGSVYNSEARDVQKLIGTKTAVQYVSGEQVSARKNPISVDVKKDSSFMSLHKDIDVIQKIDLDPFPKEGHHSNPLASNEASDSKHLSHNDGVEDLVAKQNPTDEMNQIGGGKGDGNGNFRNFQDEEDKDECSISEASCVSHITRSAAASIEEPCSSPQIADTTESDRRSCNSTSDEKTNFGNSDIKMELLKYPENAICLYESLATWTPWHLCITTGSKQMKDLVGCCNLSM